MIIRRQLQCNKAEQHLSLQFLYSSQMGIIYDYKVRITHIENSHLLNQSLTCITTALHTSIHNEWMNIAAYAIDLDPFIYPYDSINVQNVIRFKVVVELISYYVISRSNVNALTRRNYHKCQAQR